MLLIKWFCGLHFSIIFHLELLPSVDEILYL